MNDDQNNEAPSPVDSPVEVREDLDAAGLGAVDSGLDLGPDDDPVQAVARSWRQAWQAPGLLIAGGLLLLGVAYGLSTRPAPDLGATIVVANRMIEGERYEEAIELLNTEVYPWLEQSEAPPEARAAYHLAKARSIYYGQRKLRIRDERNDDAVVREYEQARRAGGVLDARDLAALANTHIAREKFTLALQEARGIPESKRYLRDAVYQRAVDAMLDRPDPMREEAMALIAEQLFDTRLPITERVWALETQGQVQLDQGHPDLVITRMLRELPRLDEASAFDRSRLRLILAQAYIVNGAVARADEQVRAAREIAASSDPHYPRLMLMKALVEDEQGLTAQARDTYEDIVQNHATSEALPLALLGLGETEAALNGPVLALEAFGRLVRDYDGYQIETYPSRQQVLGSLLDRSEESLASGQPFDAIEYASLGERLYANQRVPAEVFFSMGIAQEGAAEALLGRPLQEVPTLLGLDPAARAEVQRYLISAAVNFSLHAERHVVTNLPVFAGSLWRAADLFDRAGDQPEAINAFQSYAESMPSDPRYAEALFRQAEALRAMGDFAAAAEVYKGLIEASKQGASVNIGPLADASFVPLAQAYLYDEDPSNDREAESLLVGALDGSRGSTDTALYRDALLELSGLYDRTDRPERAIERYEEFRNRFPDDPETASVVFRLGDAKRRLGDRIEGSLDDPMPAAERARRSAEMNKHRRGALGSYEEAIGRLSARDPDSLGMFESLALRNAHFYLGDCAFDLGQYDQAILAYDRARDRYGDDPAALVAMMQIVNSYIQIGQLGRARTANERAKRFYAMMPDSVWDDPALPMDRADWERWLASSSALIADAQP